MSVADHILKTAVERTIRNTQVALDTRGDIPVDRALELIAPVNEQTLAEGIETALASLPRWRS